MSPRFQRKVAANSSGKNTIVCSFHDFNASGSSCKACKPKTLLMEDRPQDTDVDLELVRRNAAGSF